ncbi:TrkA family potassium uptake protein [Halorubrum sp. BOL3-1]|uniref:potassium channel family protein n=1 Tax=Halorubrum sp. BOL3-1 TaxID=2497325 RepID=UPI001004DC14|nr:TrkA family potassium uptake protein [Halorubrum sp. BOL3-1]QAU11551.1 TrkA family potassium uptake protein [Halorubrum sp. BOL3-1]
MSTDLRIIVVGGGHVGYHMAELLDDRGHDVVIVERDPDRCEVIQDNYVATVIEGDGTRPSILEQAQPGRSDVIASMVGDNVGTNIGVCMTARRLAPDIHTVARIDHGDGDEYDELVDSVVYPEELAAHSAANAVMDVSDGGVRTIEEYSENLELVDITATEEAPAANKRFAEIGFPRGSIVIQRQDDEELATAETVLEPGGRYLVAAKPHCLDELIRLMRG